jgi:ribonuclease HI
MSGATLANLEPHDGGISLMIFHIDGGSRGNPGPAAFGVRVEDADGHLLAEISESIGVATNNVAEYSGLLAALRHAIEHGASSVLVRSDSELLVKQMRGEYRVKHPNLKPLVEQARGLVGRIGRVRFEHIRRELNAEADRLANEAMDRAAPHAADPEDFQLT